MTFTVPGDLQGQTLEIALSNSRQPSFIAAFDRLEVTAGCNR
jgi:hypothetical protein